MSNQKAQARRTEALRAIGRGRSGRLIYDELEDILTVIKTQMKSVIQADVRRFANGAPQESSRAGRKVSGMSAQTPPASPAIRQVAAELASILLDTLGLAATIEWHLQEFRKCTGILYELTIDDAAGLHLAEEYATAIFHIYHEALSNVARHARASKVAPSPLIIPPLFFPTSFPKTPTLSRPPIQIFQVLRVSRGFPALPTVFMVFSPPPAPRARRLR